MATAALYGLLASSSFVVGVLLGLTTKPPRRVLAVVIAFGAGVLSARQKVPCLVAAAVVGEAASIPGASAYGVASLAEAVEQWRQLDTDVFQPGAYNARIGGVDLDAAGALEAASAPEGAAESVGDAIISGMSC